MSGLYVQFANETKWQQYMRQESFRGSVKAFELGQQQRQALAARPKPKPLAERVEAAKTALYGPDRSAVKARAREAAQALYGKRGAKRWGF